MEILSVTRDPGVGGNTNSCSQPTTVHNDVAADTRSRQQTLSSFSSQRLADKCRNSVGYPRQNQDQDMFDFLRSMKSDLDSQNARVTRYILKLTLYRTLSIVYMLRKRN